MATKSSTQTKRKYVGPCPTKEGHMHERASIGRKTCAWCDYDFGDDE